MYTFIKQASTIVIVAIFVTFVIVFFSTYGSQLNEGCTVYRCWWHMPKPFKGSYDVIVDNRILCRSGIRPLHNGSLCYQSPNPAECPGKVCINQHRYFVIKIMGICMIMLGFLVSTMVVFVFVSDK